jgi:bifunctional non-homologous end joining protein LigD
MDTAFKFTYNTAVKVFTRRGNDWTKRFDKFAADAWHIAAGSAIIDGEVVAPADDGTTDFRYCKTNSRAVQPGSC